MTAPKFEERPSEQWRVLLRTLPLLVRAAPRETSLLTLVLIVGGLVPAANVVLTQHTIDGVTRLARGEPANLLALTALWAATLLVGQVTGILASLLQGQASDKFIVLVTTSLMNKARALPGLDVVEDKAFHDDVELLQQAAGFRPLNLIATLVWTARDLVTVAALGVVLASVAWWVPLVMLAATVPLGRTQLQLRKLGWSITMQRTQDARELAYDNRVGLRHEYAKEVRLYDLVPWIVARYEAKAAAYQAEMRGVRARQAWGVMPASLLLTVASAGVFAYAVLGASRGALTAGGVVLVVQGLAQVRASLTSVMEYLGWASEHLLYFQKFFAFMDVTPKVAAPPRPAPVPERLDLELDNVSFDYADGRRALEGLSLRIPEGQLVAIVGENGAGKSTLVKLLLRYYDPTAGRITVGGTDLRDLDPTAWRARVGAVFQDFSRFEYTVRENIEVASLNDRDETRLNVALRGSGLDGVLASLPGGLGARLGPAFGGTELSGGQWQKLATARALYRNAQVLILDEPTAALDPRSEREVFDRFADLARGKTAILVTHRLASVRMADRVLVLRGGQLTEDGTHAELLSKGGEYAELWRLQAEKYGEAVPA